MGRRRATIAPNGRRVVRRPARPPNTAYPPAVVMEIESTNGHTLEDTAKRLSISIEQVRDRIAAGVLTATGSGDLLRVTPDSLLIYMSERLQADLRRFTQRPRPS